MISAESLTPHEGPQEGIVKDINERVLEPYAPAARDIARVLSAYKESVEHAVSNQRKTILFVGFPIHYGNRVPDLRLETFGHLYLQEIIKNHPVIAAAIQKRFACGNFVFETAYGWFSFALVNRDGGEGTEVLRPSIKKEADVSDT
jgi:hypothetical protein